MGARELEISWGVDTPWYWEFTSHPHSRFEHVAELRSVCWLDIRGKINSRMLTPNTTYGAYMVFELGEEARGLGSVNAAVRIVNEEADSEAEARAAVVHLHEYRGGRRNRTGKAPVRRSSDGWMEIELGSFCSGDGGGEGDEEARVMEIQSCHWKSGLIVEGFEFRPNA